MNIVIVSPLLPYPLIDGARKGVFYPIKALAERGHSIRLYCLTERRDPEGQAAVGRFCKVEAIENDKTPRFAAASRALFDQVPYDVQRFHNMDLLDKLRRALATRGADVVQVEGIHAAFYGVSVRDEFQVPIVLRVHNVHYVNVLRSAASHRNPLFKIYLQLEGRKLQRYERAEGRKYDLNLVVSDHDADVLHALDPEIATATVPAGVELSEFALPEMEPDQRSVLWLGALGWPPNRDSFWWFYKSILPRLVERLPDVKVKVVGSNPPSTILNLRHPNLRVMGYVPDVRQVMQESAVCVVPLQVGSGIRIKLLEMFAMRKAVVSTSIGCEGLGVMHEEHLLIADEPAEFAESIIRLLNDDRLRTRLGQRAFEHIANTFSWSRIAAKYEEAYTRAGVLYAHRENDSPRIGR